MLADFRQLLCQREAGAGSQVDQVLRTAQSYRGTPYRYGGTGREGIDCSALVYNSFSSVQLLLPRTSAEQSLIGKKVGKRKLQEGDVLFFSTGKNRREINHAGIVSRREGKDIVFIHASTSKGVMEDSLDKSYWRKTYRHGRRIF
ncbi:NLP/P60 protein [Nitritalea halalkaliphila LW7]|uniref:NLP/P60 protein n=1 Tax=Nitritalea halalkaliphila LW7 TaxID=1189621 RepID=I5CAC8_9BACT|nr:C40 family peptidase [Nitritalea halalkaliphila]EIM78780.1 NLP/P60 protein [Nitritalea halalkaliphila LW7]